jgi:hypothetical protein
MAAAAPVTVLFYLLAVRRTAAWRAALYALLTAVALVLAPAVLTGFLMAERFGTASEWQTIHRHDRRSEEIGRPSA